MPLILKDIRKLTPEQLMQAKPDVIFLSSEPYPFKEKHIAEFKTLCAQGDYQTG